MLAGRRRSAILSKAFAILLSAAMVLTMMPSMGAPVYAAEGDALTTQTPSLVVTGKGLIGNGGVYDATNVSYEKSYTVDELKGLGDNDVVNGVVYSAMKSQDPFSKNYYVVDGVKVASLLGKEESEITNDVRVYATDNYAVQFLHDGTYTNGRTRTVGLEKPRYFYDFATGEQGDQVPAVIGWADAHTSVNDGSIPPGIPTGATSDLGYLRLYAGQLGEGSGGAGAGDMNQPLFNGNSASIQVNKVAEGDEIDEVALTIGSNTYTRADVLLMDFAEAVYSYETNNGSATDHVRGVPMSVLLDGYGDNDVVTFEAADGYDVSVSGYTVKQLIDNDYVLAYEKGSSASDLAGIYETAKKDATKYGFFTLYGSDANGKPSKMVNSITVTSASGIDFSTSPYKHITNGGQSGSSPYNLDSITGATLTVEGPGVKTSVPVSVRDLEGRDAGAARAVYTDKRDGINVNRMYEGIDLYYILHNMNSGDNGIQMTDRAARVQIKNRNRSTIAEFTVDQVEEAHNTDTPIIVAYGTSLADGTNIKPFVFNGAAGADPELGNEDGCIKLVYNKNSITGDTNTSYTKFGNMAYIYVSEAETPGYKHDKTPYESPDISNYVLTVTGDKIGMEVNYTVQQLEDMVAYGQDGKPDNSGMGYRDEYSLANSNYWYVNEYEGVQLWKLLLRSGLDPALATDSEGKQTIVSSTATDGYTATDRFTIEEVSDPDKFGFYEKNPADQNDGTYEGNENIREGDDVSTGDKLRVGYPVLVAYGVNGYPYVEKSSQDGYMSGLQNDGGPLRVISGKRAYNHANGSNQAKLLDKIIVGENTYHYSTHKYHSDSVYTGLADNELSIRVLNGADEDAPVLKEDTYKIGDIEELIHGNLLTRNQLAEAKIKKFYQLTKGSSSYSDLYEGINLNFFLKNIVEIPGYKGTITFSDGTNELALSLEDVLATDNGSNTETGITGLTPLLAYGKNGAPMVLDKNADGYVKNVALAAGTDYANEITVKNDGGPLAVLFPHTDNSVSDQSLTNVTSITINLSADKYAHTNAPYDEYADDTIKIFGEGTRLGEEGKDFALSELEGKQTIAFTGDYSILKDGGGAASEIRYRGIDLYQLLTSTSVGLKSNADKVIITTTDGESKEFTLSQIRKSDYVNTVSGEAGLPVILAYGTGKAGTEDKEDGLPLVAEKTSAGYDSDYGNSGGPVRFVIGQTGAEDVNSGSNLKYVASVEVTASEMDSWNHNSSEIYRQYRDETVELVVNDKDGNNLFDKTFSVGEIEDNTSLVERITATVVQENTWEGIRFWSWVNQETGTIEGLNDPVSVTVTAADGFSQELRSNFGMDGLNIGIKDGDNYIPIILAYGVGGYPLVIGDKTHSNGEGYDATAGNNGGPLRLITHNTQGTSLTYVTKVTVVVGEGGGQPEERADFTIKGVGDKDITMSVEEISSLKNSSGDDIGKAEAQYTSKKNGTETVKGVYLKNLLAAQGVVNEDTLITLNATDGFENSEASYNNITLKDASDQNYFVAYQVQNADTGEWVDIADSDNKDNPEAGNITPIRIYREYNEAQGIEPTADWRNRCTSISGITLQIPEVTKFKEYPTSGGVRSTSMDDDGNLWVGTYGGGLYSKEAGADEFTVLNTSSTPALMTDFTSAVAADAEGGIWVSQNASYTEPFSNQGVLYIKDGEVTQYTVEGTPGTIPNNYVQAIKVGSDGKVWFGSFGGLTIYDPAEDSWVTYSKADSGFPATSVCTITLDGEGGAWLGFYPDGSGTADDPYAGGFCHITADGTVGNVVTAGGVGDVMFAQSWVRSIAVDQKGTVWAVGAGTNIDVNVGGRIWKWQISKDKLSEYTGKEIFPDYLNGSTTTEVRVVSVDEDGSLWFGTSADGVLKVSNPQLVDGKMVVDAQYAKETGSWSAANMNNVYSIDFWNGGTAYVGTSGGVLVLGNEPEPTVKPAGDATEDTADLIITGDALARDGYFTIGGIKNTDGISRVDATFRWQNSSGSTGSAAVQGATLENIFDYIGIADGAEIDSVVAVSGDERTTAYTADEIFNTDIDGNKAMFIWKEGTDKVQKTIVGQFAEGEQNRGKWAKDVIRIIVNKKTDEPSDESAGDATADTADVTFTGDALARDGYFTIKGIKNTDGISRVDATFSWRNPYGTLGSSSVQGATLENIFDYIGIAEGAEVGSVTVDCKDGFTVTYSADEIYSSDLDGNKAMFIWSEGTDKVQKTIVGRFNEGDLNRERWARDVTTITVNAKTEEDDSAAGDATEETADLTITGEALLRDGYFTIRGIKNTEGINRVDATFSWQNSSGTTGETAVQGATLENIFDYIGTVELGDSEQIEVEAVSADGRSTVYYGNEIYGSDLDGNQAMFIWTEGSDKVQKTIVGQFSEGEANKGRWAKDVNKIIVGIHTHTPGEAVIEDEVDATCAEEGGYDEVIYCSGCGEELDRNHVITDKVEHTWDSGEVTIEPTCTAKGVTTYTCTVCGATRSEEDIEALGHDWDDPEYTVAQDNSSVTASRTCKNDPGHVEIETAYTTQETVAAECEEPGSVTYSVVFENEAFSYEPWTVELEQVGHDWDVPTFEWAEDYSTVTATRVCKRDSSHIETETVETTSFVTREATCEEMGETTYTAVFTNDGFGVQTMVVEDIDPIEHEWGPAEYEWAADNSSVTASHTCLNNPAHVETETAATSSEVVAEPTYDAEGQTKYTAVFTTEGFEEQSITIADIPTLQKTSEEMMDDAAIQDAAAMGQAYEANTAVDEGSVDADNIISGATAVADAAAEAATAAQEAANSAYESAVELHGEDSEEAQNAKDVVDAVDKLVASTRTSAAAAKTAAAKAAGKKAASAQAAASSAAMGTADAVDKAQAAESAASAAVDAAATASAAAQAALEAAEAAGLSAGDEIYDSAAATAAAAEAELNAANEALDAASASVAEAQNAKNQADAAAAADAAAQAEIAANNGVIDPKLPKVKIKSAKKAKKAFTARWKKLSKKQQKLVKGIEVEYSLTRDFSGGKFKTAGKKKTSVKIKKLQSKKTYYVRAHTYVIRNGVRYVSPWSAVKKVKVK